MFAWLFYAVLSVCGIVLVIKFTQQVLKNLKKGE